jgi:hypothetical protein
MYGAGEMSVKKKITAKSSVQNSSLTFNRPKSFNSPGEVEHSTHAAQSV